MALFKEAYWFFRNMASNHGVVAEMVRYDFKAKYLGSYLGILWAFIHPLMTIAVLWFVFSFGFKASGVHDVAFIPWLSTAMIPWFYFSDTVNDATASILNNAFLVKKTNFRLSLLPIVKMCSNAIIHVSLIVVLAGLLMAYGIKPTLIWLQLFYYLFSMLCLVLGISWITSAVAVFTKDVNNIVAVSLQMLFWATPIFWDLGAIPRRVAVYVQINPVYYIVSGYRDTFLYGVPFWERPELGCLFWWCVFVVWLIGFLVYTKLRPHFADVI